MLSKPGISHLSYLSWCLTSLAPRHTESVCFGQNRDVSSGLITTVVSPSLYPCSSKVHSQSSLLLKMTSLPRLYSDHETRATQFLQVFLWKSTAYSGKLVAPQRNAVGPIKLHNDQSTIIVAWMHRGTTLASLGELAGGHFLFRRP